MVPSGLPRPVPVIVRQFTKEQMSKVIADKLKERQARDDVEHRNDVQWEDEVRVYIVGCSQYRVTKFQKLGFFSLRFDYLNDELHVVFQELCEHRHLDVHQSLPDPPRVGVPMSKALRRFSGSRRSRRRRATQRESPLQVYRHKCDSHWSNFIKRFNSNLFIGYKLFYFL